MINVNNVHEYFLEKVPFGEKLYKRHKSKMLFNSMNDLMKFSNIDMPKNKDDKFHLLTHLHGLREVYNYFVSWPLISNELVTGIEKNINKRFPLFNMMCGKGVISKVLNCEVVNVDMNPGIYDDIDIVVSDALEFTKRNRSKMKQVLLSWPPYEDRIAFEIVRNLNPGTNVLYVGEDSIGCNADPNFHQYMRECNPRKITIPKFPCIGDNLYIFKTI